MSVLDTSFTLSRKISDIVERASICITVFYIAAVFCVVFLGVIMRVIGSTFSWSEEISRWLLIGITYIGASLALKRRQHVGIALVIRALPRAWCRIAVILIDIAVIAFIYYGFRTSLATALQSAKQFGDIIKLPMMYVKLNLPVGFLFMFVHMVYFLLGAFRAEDPQDFILSS